ncbi:MAG: polysaccharide biosynthesis tyrosine autokinase [Oscillospiraceae bacterium]|nr:polysaccharide biosynthesis tyrosine autokinase [Oscillospiraceae bacterium]
MKNDYTIESLIKLFLTKIWIIIVVTLLGGITAFCFSKFVLPLQYSSHISMYVQSYTDVSEDTDKNQNNISNSKQLINTYVEVLKDDVVMRAVGHKLEAKYSEQTLKQYFTLNDGQINPSSLRSCITITAVSDTSALNVTAVTGNDKISADICNNLARVSQRYIQKAVGVGSISTIDTAKIYETPVSPDILKNTALGMMAGFVLILAVILLIDFFDNTVKDIDVLSKKYNKAILGQVMHFKSETEKNDNYGYFRLVDKNVPFYITESYKAIRTNISFALSTFEKKIIAVSSANPGEGKSTTSANIAIATAQSGKPVLLIDADMRESVQHKIFGLKNNKGLSLAISKMNETDECIQKNVMENLDVMTAGPVPPNPSELLSSESMRNLLKELSSQYALIIIDLPPICIVSDAVTLSNEVAGLVTVVRYGKTTFEDLQEVNKRTELCNMNILGYVLNDISHKNEKSSYYKYKYDYNENQ